MPSFSKISQSRLDGCHQELITLFHYVIQIYDCTIVCGERGEEEQTDAFNRGASKVKYPNSRHNKKPSEAVDVAPYENGGLDYGKDQMYFFAGFVLGCAKILKKFGAMTRDIRLGADWDGDNDINDQKFVDSCHFELVKKVWQEPVKT